MILHICCGVPIQKLYRHLFGITKQIDGEQIVYVPCNTKSKMGINLEEQTNAQYRYFAVESLLKRILYFPKIKQHFRQVSNLIQDKTLKFCFAHTCYTDGGIAYLLWKQKDIPYIVTLRSTDIFIYKRLFFLRPFFWKICEKASLVNCPNPAYAEWLTKRAPQRLKLELRKKIAILPNGISSFWFENLPAPKCREKTDPVTLLFVGRIDKYKNVETIVKALEIINEKIHCKLLIVGAFHPQSAALQESLQSNNQVICLGPVHEQKELLDIYRKADVFVMPSLIETFGLVYIEAMSQGLPVIYTQGQGISGYFPEGTVGYGMINPKSPNELADHVFSILENYDATCEAARQGAHRFEWLTIGKTLLANIDSLVLN